jgi:WD40 repeat protein/DNA-binding SARP family transcriptional activator
VEFRILGPFEAVENGRSLALGSSQQRAVLAVLLLHRSEVLSTDRLVDELWGERAPPTAAKIIQGYISHLRKALGEGMIVTQGRGYVLAVAPEQLDVSRFEFLASDGRRALAGGDAARASQQLEAALGLWRGEPLADFAYEPFAQSEIARLQELRLAAYEDRIDADLALGRDGDLIPEIERLIASNQLRERLRGQLMVSLYRSGRQADALAIYRQTSELLREELGLEPGPNLKRLERMILEQDPELSVAPTRVRPVGERVVCPFKGLAFFDRADAAYFCGRERVVAELVARLADSSLVGILGPSGIGKSSLLRAGVLPALSAGVLPGSAAWRQVLLRPGQHPGTELLRAVGDGGLKEAVMRLGPGERIVVAVDQLEELFIVCDGEDERVEFLEQLVGAARDPERRALVVCSLRSDFYGRVGSYPRFAELLSRNHVLVGPMDPDELARAIEQPAARAALEVEPALVNALVSDVLGERGGLPLLSTTLLELWWASDGHTLRLERYRTTGGVHGAVARLAEDAYNHFGKREQLVARTVMLRLATGEGETLSRRRVPLAELNRIQGAEPVVVALTDGRLLTVSDEQVELSHEALLREWPRYREWLEEDRVGRRLHAHLTTAATEWEARGRDPGELYRAGRLTAAADWSAQHGDQLNSLELEFIAASRRRVERDTRRLRAALVGVALLLLLSLVAGGVALIQKRHATAAARVALARELGAEGVSEPRIDLALLLAREGVNLDPSAQTEGTLFATLLRTPAVIRTFAVPTHSGLLALAPDGRTLTVSGAFPSGVHFYDPRTYAVQRAPLTDFLGSQPPVYSSDGSLLVYPTTGSLVVRDAHKLVVRNTLEFDQTRLMQEFTSDGGILIAPDRRAVYYSYTVTDDAGNPTAAYVDRWSLPNGRLLSKTRIGPGAILALRLTDEGNRLLVVAGSDISEFDAHSMERVRSIAITPAPASPSAAAISPDGRTVAIGSDSGSVSFVDLSTGTVRQGVGGHAASVASVLYSPQGRTVVTVGDDDKVIVWDLKTASPTETLTGHTGEAQGAAISPDGRTLFTSSLDDTVLVWDLAGDRRFGRRSHLGDALPCCSPVSPLSPPLALSPDGSRFASPISASTIGLFSARTLQRLDSFKITPRRTVITALAWSPTGRQLAVAGFSGLVQLWNVNGTPRPMRSMVGLHPLSRLPEAIQAIAFSADGRFVAATDLNETPSSPGNNGGVLGRLTIWKVNTGTLAAVPRDLGVGRAFPLASSPAGNLLALVTTDGGVLVLNIATGQARRTLHPDDVVTSLAFGPDGTLATGTLSGKVVLWKPRSTDRAGASVIVASGAVTSVAFDPSGQRFATTGDPDGSVRLWSTSTLQQQGTPLDTDRGATTTAALGPGGQRLLVINDRNNGFIWPTSPAAWEQRACAVAARNLTRQEWARFVTGHRYAKVCP